MVSSRSSSKKTPHQLCLQFLICMNGNQNNRINSMQASLEQKYKEIFQVKIKQQRLCQLLQSFSIKIHNLEDSHKALQNTFSMNNVLDEVKMYVKTIFKEETSQMAYKFYEKIEVCNKEINRIDYSCKVFEKNIRTEFDNLNEKEKLLQKTVSYISSQEMQRLRTDIQKLNTSLILSKSQMMNQIQTDQLKFSQVYDKFNGIKELLDVGDKKIEDMQQAIDYLGKKIDDLKHSETLTSKTDNQRENVRQRLPTPQIIKKSRISTRRTVDNINFQRTIDQLKETPQYKQNKQGKERRQKREPRESDFTTINKKIQNLEKKVLGIVDANFNIPTSQKIQNERESIISNQQLLEFNRYDSNQNFDRNSNRTNSTKRNISNFKRGSIKTEQNHDQIAQDHGRFVCANSIQANQIRKINDKITSLHFKNSLLEQNYEALLNKINKLGSLQASIQSKIDEAEKLRLDLNTVNEIKLRFKQIQTSMELQEIRYVNHSTYHKEIENIHKKITAIQSVIPMLAKKEEVVSAFSFVQNKIKQIVIVLSNKFEEEKLGAINKIQHIRCLTCDKETNLANASRPTSKINVRSSQNNRFSYDKQELTKRMKTDQNQ